MFQQYRKKQRGFMSTSLSKKIALEFTNARWNENNRKIPVIMEIYLN